MALIPIQYFDAVVSIEVDSKDSDGKPAKKSVATGFLLGTPMGEKDKDDQELYNLSLITNRHVYEDRKTGDRLKKIYLRFNTINESSHYFEVNLLKKDETTLWFKHKNDDVDIAVLPLNASALKSADVKYYFFHDNDLFFAKNFKEDNISIGDGLYVLGFPMSIRGKNKNFVIARQGIAARIDNELLSNCYYYIDALAYPGNSGGPVIHKPEIVCLSDTQSNPRAGLMGVISSGETYSDVAVSIQTQEPRIIFTEQTGLVRVVPIELVTEAIEDFINSQRLKEKKSEEVNKTDEAVLKKIKE